MPNRIVKSKASLDFLKFFLIMQWWAHVIENPDLTKITVFRRGTLIGLKGLIELGGHIMPISILGLIPAWKNAQKNLKKNRTSDKINRTILFLIVFITLGWCNPSLLAS